MLNTKVGSIEFRTPLILASGYITETPEFFLRAQLYGCAGMVTRSLKEHIPIERLQTPSPRYSVFDNGESMLNCEWGNEKTWNNWRDDYVYQVKNINYPIIISLSGRDLDGCVNLIKSFDEIGVDAYEINISCSHSGSLHGNLNINLSYLEQLMKRIRPVTNTPIWIKLSYSILLLDMAKRAEECGANAVVCTNSIGPGMLIDTKTSKPKLGIKGGGGGVTGKAIFPIALWCVHQLAKTLHIPVVGSGGIYSGDDVVQMLMAGASAVQLYTAPALKGPKIFQKITNDLSSFMKSSNYSSVSELIGLTLEKTKYNVFSASKPMIVTEECTGCGICKEACNFNAIELIKAENQKVAFILDNCVSCNACVGVCPPQSNAIQVNF